MPIETGMYSNLRSIAAPSIGDAVEGGLRMKGQRLQNERAQKQMEAEDHDRAYLEHARKASLIGETLNSVAGLPPEQQAAAYSQARQQLIGAGVIRPEDAPEQYDRGFVGMYLAKHRESEPYIKNALMKSDMELKKSMVAKNEAEAAKLKAEGANPAKTLTPGEEMADKTFGKDAAEYYYGGGKATVEKNLQRLEGAINKLRGNPDPKTGRPTGDTHLTGGWSTKVPGLGADAAQDVLNPEMASVRDDIRAAIQGTLRQVLGAQFTEKEGEAIFNRAFNPRLSAQENVRRATAELQSLRNMAADKDRSMQQFAASGTLKGLRPGATNLSGQAQAPQGRGGYGQAYATEPPDFNSMSDEELQKYVGGQ